MLCTESPGLGKRLSYKFQGPIQVYFNFLFLHTSKNYLYIFLKSRDTK